MNKLKLTINFILLFPVMVAAQIFPQEGDDVGSLIPENYILKEVNFGDLNGDSKNDLVIVIRNKITNKKSAAIYFYDLHQWKLITESENFFLLENTDIFDPSIETSVNRKVYEEYVYIYIENSIITITTSDGYGNEIGAKFRTNQEGNYEIIGVEFGNLSRNIEEKNSINYLTSKMQTTLTSTPETSEPQEQWYKVINLKRIFFDNFSVKKILSDIDKLKFEKINN